MEEVLQLSTTHNQQKSGNYREKLYKGGKPQLADNIYFYPMIGQLAKHRN